MYFRTNTEGHGKRNLLYNPGWLKNSCLHFWINFNMHVAWLKKKKKNPQPSSEAKNTSRSLEKQDLTSGFYSQNTKAPNERRKQINALAVTGRINYGILSLPQKSLIHISEAQERD